MIMRLPGIYEERLSRFRDGETEINIFLIPGNHGERSLMIDCGL